MRTRRILFTVLLTSLLLACNFPLVVPATQPSPTLGSSIAPLDTATASPATLTPIPTAIPTATTNPTPSVPEVTPISANVNCRSGPDVGYNAISVLESGQFAQIAGRNNDSSWWYIHDPSNPTGFCWVAASVVMTSGPMVAIPVIAPPAAIVTKVTVAVSLPSSVFCGGPNAIEFSGMITTNGPVKVKFQWETGGDKTNPPVPGSLTFKAAGTQEAPSPGAYSVDCGHYTIALHVTSPNNISSATKSYKVSP